MNELKLQLLTNSEDFLDTVEILLDLNGQGELSDEDLLLNLKSKYESYSLEKIRILNLLAAEELRNNDDI